MALREMRAFIDGVRAAFPSKRKTGTQPSAPESEGPHRVIGQSVGFLAVAVLILAAVVVAAVGLAGKRAATGASKQIPPPHANPLQPEEISYVINWDADVSARNWTSIVLHHSATEGGSAASFDAYHRNQKGWQSLGYHFVIGNGSGTPDGVIEVGPRWSRQKVGAHANSAEYNRHGIGICLVGNFEHSLPTEAQIKATKALVVALAERFNIEPDRIIGHCDIREGGTACPGRHFPMDEVRKSVKR